MGELPDWNDMPEASAVIKVSWEDIYERYQEKGINPTKQMVMAVFSKMEHKGADSMMEGFWDTVDYHIDNLK